MSTSYKVVAIWGAQKHTTELGEFATLDEAMDRFNTWHDAPEVQGMKIDLLEVIKVTNVTVLSEQPVYSANTAPRDCGEDGGETQDYVDYERVGVKEQKPDYASDTVLQMQRVGVPPSTGRFESILTQPNEQVRDTFQPFDDLQETVRNLEDRHVGLRHALSEDIDYVYDHITELRDELSKEIVAVRRDVTMDVMNSDSDIRALKNEVEVLRREMESLRERTAGRKG